MLNPTIAKFTPSRNPGIREFDVVWNGAVFAAEEFAPASTRRAPAPMPVPAWETRLTKIRKICQRCGGTFDVIQSQADRRAVCSRACPGPRRGRLKK